MPLISCSACGQQVSDEASVCPHCGQPAGRSVGRRGLPVWGKILLFLLPGAILVGFCVATKPSEAELRQVIRDKGEELKAKGVLGPPVSIDDPQLAERFTYHDLFLSSEIRFTTDGGKVITVASGQFGNITVSESWR